MTIDRSVTQVKIEKSPLEPQKDNTGFGGVAAMKGLL